ncbi:hypothetical protein PSPO01_05457 [Paraphaeosphaeria sporulosa]
MSCVSQDADPMQLCQDVHGIHSCWPLYGPRPSEEFEDVAVLQHSTGIRPGLRIVEGTPGIFFLGNENKFLHVKFLPSIVSTAYVRWSWQGRQHQRSIGMDRVNTTAHKDQAVTRWRILGRD